MSKEKLPSESKDVKTTQDKGVDLQRLVRHTFTYDDMVKAFSAGRKHMRECGNTQDDCWDFITWLREQYV